MDWKKYKMIMKHSGLSWLGHIMPFGIIVALELGMNSHTSSFDNKPCRCHRFGNSGLFLVYSQDVQDKLEESRRKSREWVAREKEDQERKEYEKLKKKYDASKIQSPESKVSFGNEVPKDI